MSKPKSASEKMSYVKDLKEVCLAKREDLQRIGVGKIIFNKESLSDAESDLNGVIEIKDLNVKNNDSKIEQLNRVFKTSDVLDNFLITRNRREKEGDVVIWKASL